MSGRYFDWGISGRIIEGELLKKIETLEPRNEYQSYKEATRFVREHQPGNPSEPDPRFANDLHATVAIKLALKDFSQLKFYTAVGSPLDRFHGIDGFFEWEVDPQDPEKTVIVTLDITTNPQKETHKADIIIQVPKGGLDPKEDKKAFSELVEKSAAGIVDCFNRLKERS